MVSTKSLLSVAIAVLQLASVCSAGISRRANSDATGVVYSPDGRTCCTDGESEAAFAGVICEYGTHILVTQIPEDTRVTKCCWSDEANNFHVHYANNHEERHTYPINITGTTTLPNHFCNLQLKWDITEYILTDDYLDINVNLNFDCATYNKSDREWIRVHFDSAYQDAGRFTYEISPVVGPTIYITVASKIQSSDFSVDFHGHITGTGVISRLDEQFDRNLRTDEVAAIIAKANICDGF
ncbi:hypothetical protein V8C35DRAFT_164012 [Trichoderma chlorosporum]